MSKHLVEPLKISNETGEYCAIVDANRFLIALAFIPNAKRIIACVNACQGYTTDRLETIVKEGESLLIRFNRLNDKPDVLNIIREENRQLASEIEALRKQLHRL